MPVVALLCGHLYAQECNVSQHQQGLTLSLVATHCIGLCPPQAHHASGPPACRAPPADCFPCCPAHRYTYYANGTVTVTDKAGKVTNVMSSSVSGDVITYTIDGMR